MGRKRLDDTEGSVYHRYWERHKDDPAFMERNRRNVKAAIDRMRQRDPDDWKRRNRERQARYRAENPEMRAAANARRNERRRGDAGRAGRLRKYGLTVAEYDAMVEAQQGVCFVCSQPQPKGKRLYVDHCHTSGKVRGLLCRMCNLRLGWFEKYQSQIKLLLE
jgi:recombination endonuclease VII